MQECQHPKVHRDLVKNVAKPPSTIFGRLTQSGKVPVDSKKSKCHTHLQVGQERIQGAEDWFA